MAMPEFTMRQLLEAGVHFGHQTRRWNPQMAPYLFGVRNNVHIIDLQQTVPMLRPRAAARCATSPPAGGRVLFVGTKRAGGRSRRRGSQALRPVLRQPPLARRHADQLEDDLRQSIKRLRQIDETLSGRHRGPDQEGGPAHDPRARQARARAGRHQGHGRAAGHPVRHRHQQGEASRSPKPTSSASRWWRCSTATPTPTASTFPIPGNDDAIRAITLYCDLVAGAVLDGISAELAASGGRHRRRRGDAGRDRWPPKPTSPRAPARRRPRPPPSSSCRRNRRDCAKGRDDGRDHRCPGQGTAREDRRRHDGLQEGADGNRRRHGGGGRLAAQEGPRRGGEEGRPGRRPRAWSASPSARRVAAPWSR